MAVGARVDVVTLDDVSDMILEVERLELEGEATERPCALAMLCAEFIGMRGRYEDIPGVFRIGHLDCGENIGIAGQNHMVICWCE